MQEITKLDSKNLNDVLNNKNIQQILQTLYNNIINDNIAKFFTELSSLNKDKLDILLSNNIAKQIIEKTIDNSVNNNSDKYLIQLSFEKKEIFDIFFIKNDGEIIFNDSSLDKYINIAKLCELMSFSIDKYKNNTIDKTIGNRDELLKFVEFGLEKIEMSIKGNKFRKVEINALIEILKVL